MHFSLKIWHLVAPIFHFPWLFQKKYFPPTFPWPLKFPDFFSSFPWPVGTLIKESQDNIIVTKTRVQTDFVVLSSGTLNLAQPSDWFSVNYELHTLNMPALCQAMFSMVLPRTLVWSMPRLETPQTTGWLTETHIVDWQITNNKWQIINMLSLICFRTLEVK